MKKLAILAAAIVAGASFYKSQHAPPPKPAPVISAEKGQSSSDSILADAFSNHRSHLQVSGQGVVTKVLPDDTDGRRHQRFIVALSSGQTLLIAHNIDLAPKIDSLRVGDSVQFYGEYEWNAKGGTGKGGQATFLD